MWFVNSERPTPPENMRELAFLGLVLTRSFSGSIKLLYAYLSSKNLAVMISMLVLVLVLLLILLLPMSTALADEAKASDIRFIEIIFLMTLAIFS